MTENDEGPELKSATRPPGVFDEAFLTGVEGVTEVVLVRHAQQDFKLEGLAGDWVDPPLTEQGRAQAALVGEALSTKPLQAIFASPLKRAKETAEAIAKHHKSLEIEFNRELREVEVSAMCPRTRRCASLWATTCSWRRACGC